MLGYVFGLALVLTVFTPVIFTEAFADSFTVSFDKEIYDLGDSLSISGEIIQLGMPVIAMSIYDPDGKILSANNLEITSEQKFSKTIPQKLLSPRVLLPASRVRKPQQQARPQSVLRTMGLL